MSKVKNNMQFTTQSKLRVLRSPLAWLGLGAAALLLGQSVTSVQIAQAGASGINYASPNSSELPAEFVAEWMTQLYNRVQEERLSAPAASRMYAYAGIAAYEGMVPWAGENRSLSGQLNELGQLPFPNLDETHDPILVTDSTLHYVFNGLMREHGADNAEVFDAFFDERVAERTAEIEAEIVDADERTPFGNLAIDRVNLDDAQTIADRSIRYGNTLGEALVDWIKDDGYADMREYALDHPYEPDIVPGRSWVATAEGQQPAEPYWGQYIRLFNGYVSDACYEPIPVEYNEEVGSDFYQQALEVMNVGDSLTQEQRDIASWWVDTPGITGAPAGHWVMIENQLVDQFDLTLLQAGEMYGMVGMVLGDAFTTAWTMKFNDPLVRPITYIHDHINNRWTSFIETPPFPEFPSGHSVVSAAAADMLTFLFGPRHFEDATHRDRGLGVRTYVTFEQAAYEAAISRLYGGIHYRSAIETGMEIGDCVSEYALNNIVMRPVSQGGA